MSEQGGEGRRGDRTRTIARWLLGAGVLVAFAAGGEALQRAASLPIPGSTLGMIALLVVLVLPFGNRLMRVVAPAADTLIAVLPLLLVPLAVGVIGAFGTLAEHALAIIAALVVGWLATFLTAVFVADLLMRGRS
ncbi:CidA/LrgA family protein [Microbacterium halophytorum]|uniref:CidA/LrgA family protein n=1 Tax=Microbacterium halophytorum TaxID=2067568 RepID=UPI001319C2AE|nr:CidA/LrgA family protein [Microbacterium halophytorum]